jgi:hypothetical protein
LSAQSSAAAGRRSSRRLDDTYLWIAPSVNTARANEGVDTRGFWAQAVAHPGAQVDVLLGYAVESPRTGDLKGVAARTNNIMYGGGVIVNLYPSWKVGAEAYNTLSWTHDAAGAVTKRESPMLALATRLDF